MKTKSKSNAAREAGQTKLTITQSEDLRMGERREYTPSNPTGVFAERIAKHGISVWLEKRPKTPDAYERNLRHFIALDFSYELVYGLTYKGKDYDCGSMPRDLGYVVKGIDIGASI